MSINSGLVGHLPALPLLLPLIAAPVAALLNISGARILFAVIMATLSAVAIYSLVHFWRGGPEIVYFFGDWPAPLGIELRLNAAIAVILALMALTGLASALNEFGERGEENSSPQYYCLFLLCYAGLSGMALTYDIFNLYVFLEITSLATYALIGLGRDRRALTAAFEYLILGSIGAGFILLGIGLVYMLTGTLNMHDAAALLPRSEKPMLTGTALAFFVVGLAMKLAVAPMHLWLVNSYTNAPGNVATFLSATATKVALLVLFKIVYVVFGGGLAMEAFHLSGFLFWTGALGILFGAYMAAMQHHVKRVLAYSSVSHIGYIFLAASYSEATGLIIATIFIIHHGILKASLFLTADYLERRFGPRLSDLKSAVDASPFAASVLSLCALGLAGLPGMTGFSAKWALLSYVVSQGDWPAVIVIAAGSLLAFVYMGRILEACWFDKSRMPKRYSSYEDFTPKAALWLALAGFALSVFLGCRYDVLRRLAQMTADSFL